MIITKVMKMRWADNSILDNCKYKSRKKRIEWLINYWYNLELEDDYICYSPDEILEIFLWLDLIDKKG